MSNDTEERESAFQSFTRPNGEVFNFFDEDLAVKQLMERDIMDVYFAKTERGHKTMSLGVNTNDMFYFAVSDMQHIESEQELQDLYREYERDPKYGHVVWLSRKEGIQPCKRCYIEPMKNAGSWTEEMEALPPGPQS